MDERGRAATRAVMESEVEDARFEIRRVDDAVDATRSRMAAHESRFQSFMQIMSRAWRGGQARHLMRRVDDMQMVVMRGYLDRLRGLDDRREQLTQRCRTLSERLEDPRADVTVQRAEG